MVGTPYSYNFNQNLQVSGDAGYNGFGVKWAVVSGSLPTGLTLNPTTGVLSGTPVQNGTASFVLDATYMTKTGEQSYQIPVQLGILVSLGAGSPSQGIVGQAYNFDLNSLVSVANDSAYAGAGSGVTWSVVSSTLPAGLYLTNSGKIGGTPTAAGSGSVTARATYKGASGDQSYQVVTLNIVTSLATSASPLEGIVGVPFTYDLKPLVSVTGDNTYSLGAVTWNVVSGPLPAGLTLDSSTGVISGTPTAAASGNVTLGASYRGQNGTQVYQIQMLNIAVALATATPTAALVGTAYTYDFKPLVSATGDSSYAVSKVTWKADTLPAGLALSTDGVLSGTPTTAVAAAPVNVTATYRTKTATKSYAVTVNNNVKNQGSYRTWSDGTVAASCKGYMSPTAPNVYQGATGDGVYRIKPAGSSSTVDVFCDMTTDGGGWMMAYKWPKGLTSQPSAVWAGSTAYGTTPNKTTAEIVYVPTLTSTSWSSITEARMELVTGGTAKAFIKFSTVGQDKNSWFAKSNVLSSTWTDLTSSTQNYFSIAGDAANYRNWQIHGTYAGCPNDTGWMLITYDPAHDTCVRQGAWYSAAVGAIFYSTASTKQILNTGSMGFADALVVLVR